MGDLTPTETSSTTTFYEASVSCSESVMSVQQVVERQQTSDAFYEEEVRHKNELLAEKERLIEDLRQKESSSVADLRNESKKLLDTQAEKLTHVTNLLREKESVLEEAQRIAITAETKFSQANVEKLELENELKRLRGDIGLSKRELGDQTAQLHKLDAAALQLQLEKRELTLELERSKNDLTRLRRELEAQRSLEMSLRLEVSNLTTHVTGKSRLVEELRTRVDSSEVQVAATRAKLKQEHESAEYELLEKYRETERELASNYAMRLQDMMEAHKNYLEDLERKHQQRVQALEDTVTDKENTCRTRERMIDEMTRKHMEREEQWQQKLHDIEVENDRMWASRLNETEAREQETNARLRAQMQHMEKIWMDKCTVMEQKLTAQMDTRPQTEEAVARAKAAEEELYRTTWELEECQTRTKRLEEEVKRLRWEGEEALSRAKKAEQALQSSQWEHTERIQALEGEVRSANWKLEEEVGRKRRLEEDMMHLQAEYERRVSSQEAVIQQHTHLRDALRIQEEESTRRAVCVMHYMDVAAELKLQALGTFHELTIREYRTCLKLAREDASKQKQYPYLGVEVSEEVPVPVIGHSFTGVKVSLIKEGGPALVAGMMEGDAVRFVEVIHRAEIRDLLDFRVAIEKVRPGDVIAFTLERGNEWVIKELVVQGSERDHHKPIMRRKTGEKKLVAIPSSPQSTCSEGGTPIMAPTRLSTGHVYTPTSSSMNTNPQPYTGNVSPVPRRPSPFRNVSPPLTAARLAQHQQHHAQHSSRARTPSPIMHLVSQASGQSPVRDVKTPQSTVTSTTMSTTVGCTHHGGGGTSPTLPIQTGFARPEISFVETHKSLAQMGERFRVPSPAIGSPGGPGGNSSPPSRAASPSPSPPPYSATFPQSPHSLHSFGAGDESPHSCAPVSLAEATQMILNEYENSLPPVHFSSSLRNATPSPTH